MSKILKSKRKAPTYTHSNAYVTYSSTARYKDQLDKGCFRFVPDTYHDDNESWREAIYSDTRPVYMRKAKNRVDRWLRDGY